MQITLHGVRGSVTTGLPPEDLTVKIKSMLEKLIDHQITQPEEIAAFVRKQDFSQRGTYGSNTLCTEIRTGDGVFVVDSGSGIRNFARKYDDSLDEYHVFLSHVHWDHLCGLPDFFPLYNAKNQIHFYSAHPDLELGVRSVFQKPYHAASFEELPARITFHSLQKYRIFEIHGIEITPYQIDHPNLAFGYHLQEGSTRVLTCFDTEFKRMKRVDLGDDLPYYQNADLILFDGQYTISDLLRKINWGHCTPYVGIDLCLRECISKLVIVCHDPASSDQHLGRQEKLVENYHKEQIEAYKALGKTVNPLEIIWGYEGLTLEI